MIKPITSATKTQNKKFVATPSIPQHKRYFTPMEVVEFLQQIDELKELKISFKRVSDGNIEFTVGNNVYTTSNSEQTE